MPYEKQNGNVLFLILIAVALFAALSYVITKSTRGSGGQTENEKIRLVASQILNYSSTLRTATQRMLIQGTSSKDIRLHKTGQSWNPCTSAEPHCLFDPKEGGGIALDLFVDKEIEVYGNSWAYDEYADNTRIYQLGTDEPELVLRRQIQLNEKGRRLCEALNKGLGLPAAVPEEDGTHASVATYAAAPHQVGACVKNYADFYLFYYTLADN